MSTLTKRNLKILKVVETFISEHKFPPTLRELCQITGIKSTNGVRVHLKKLEKAGKIKKDGRLARGLSIVEEKHFCARCGNCCRIAGKVFKSFRGKEGDTCRHFDEKTVSCKIWNNRPEVCRTDDLVKRWSKEGVLKPEEYYAAHERSCRRISKLNKPPFEELQKIVLEEMEGVIKK